ncbi:unnamed protein product, partial [Iphiclides podalirius]
MIVNKVAGRFPRGRGSGGDGVEFDGGEYNEPFVCAGAEWSGGAARAPKPAATMSGAQAQCTSEHSDSKIITTNAPAIVYSLYTRTPSYTALNCLSKTQLRVTVFVTYFSDTNMAAVHLLNIWRGTAEAPAAPTSLGNRPRRRRLQN